MDESAICVKFRGQSGREYSYECYHMGDHFKKSPGNYIFAKKVQSTGYIPVHIGHASDMSDHFYSHCRSMPCIYHEGAHYVCVHYNHDTEEERQAEAWDLMEHWRPQCNIETKIHITV